MTLSPRSCPKRSTSAAIAEFRLQNPHPNSSYLPDTPSFLFGFFARNSAISPRKRFFGQLLKEIIISFAIVAVGASVGYVLIALAESGNDISYPVAELGNCKNETECRAYCDKPENIKPCVAFAEAHNLISAEEAERAKKFAEVGSGPGGCKNKSECETYCEDSSRMNVCLDFAENNGLMSGEELDEARKVAKALESGARTPGNCKKKEQCDAYCDDSSNIEECMAFAEAAGLIPPEELGEARKAMQAIKSGLRPPGNCRGKKQCEAYCQEPPHAEECFNFAAAAGFIPPEEVENAKKVMPFMMRGEMPGGCKGKEECESYCADDAHGEECANFAIKAGLMSEKDAEMFRKTGGKGPGDCKGKKECEGFCNNPANQETCFNFAKEHGLIPPEELERMKEGTEQMQSGLENAPPEVKDCLQNVLGSDAMEKIRSGEMMPGLSAGENIRTCFEKNMPWGPEGFQGSEDRVPPPGMPPQGEFKGGPGGCATKEECESFCEENPEACQNFGPGGPSQERFKPPEGRGGMSPEEFRREMMPSEDMLRRGVPEGFQEKPEGFRENFLRTFQGAPGYPEEGQFREPPEGFRHPEGFSPSEEFRPPEELGPREGFQMPGESNLFPVTLPSLDRTFIPPTESNPSPAPENTFSPPPSGATESPPPPPSSQNILDRFFADILIPLLGQ